MCLDTDLATPPAYPARRSFPISARNSLASAPFLVKVFPRSRTGETTFVFRAHLHQGVAPWTRSSSLLQCRRRRIVPSGSDPQPRRFADVVDGYDEVVPAGRPAGPGLTQARRHDRGQRPRGRAPFSVGLVREKGGIWTLLEQQGQPATIPAAREDRQRRSLYVQVTRNDQPSRSRVRRDRLVQRVDPPGASAARHG